MRLGYKTFLMMGLTNILYLRNYDETINIITLKPNYYDYMLLIIKTKFLFLKTDYISNALRRKRLTEICH